MNSARYGDSIAVRFQIGEDVHQGISEVCRKHGVTQGFVVSGIGMLADPEVGFFVSKGKYDSKVFTGRFELLSLSGNISMHGDKLMAHIHAMCSDEDHRVFGGHLFSGKVGLTLEMLVTVIDKPVNMYRELEEESGLAGLKIN